MGRIGITRRKLVKTLLALGAGGVFASGVLSSEGGKVWAFLGDGMSEFEKFSSLSSLLTLHDDLDEDSVRKMHKVFMDEPWAPEHIVGLYKKLDAALGGKGKTRPSLKDKSWNFTEGESWFAGHLLTTWYLGVYYHQERPTQRILYETALGMRATAGKMPVPYLENVGYGAWSHAPESEK